MKVKNCFLALILSVSMLLSGCSSETPVSGSNETAASVSVSEPEIEDSEAAPTQSTVPSPEIGEPTSESSEQAANSSENSTETSLTDSAVTTPAASENETVSTTQTKPAVTTTEPVVTTTRPLVVTTAQTVVTTTEPPVVTTAKPAVTTTKPPVVTATQPAVTTAELDEPDGRGGFYVDKTGLYDANGNEFVMRGVNHAHTWFKNELNTAIPAIAATGANTVRIVLSSGEQWAKNSASDVKNVIELCKKNKLICVLEVHDITGKNDIAGLRSVTDYWIEIKNALIGNEAYVILNIANEWIGDWDSETWYNGYSEAVKRLRNAGLCNTIMIDAAGWGQYGEPIGKYGKKLLQDDIYSNLMFSVHMYGTAGGSPESIRRNLGYATDNGLCVIVGEFGYNHSDGDVDEAYIMKYCTENNLGYLGWSWKGNGGGVEYLDIALDWEGKRLSSDWGEILINGANGIKETSKICTVF